MFPGVKPGDQWCLCAQRWAQAYNEGKAPKLHLKRTHERTLDHVPLEILLDYAVDRAAAEAELMVVDAARKALEASFSVLDSTDAASDAA